MPIKMKNTVAGICGGFVVEASSALQMLNIVILHLFFFKELPAVAESLK